eukprot:CFRG1619T1
MGKRKAAGFYAVRKGRVPGVYATWTECAEQVNGFAGAKHQKFTTLAEAEKFMSNENTLMKETESAPPKEYKSPSEYQTSHTPHTTHQLERLSQPARAPDFDYTATHDHTSTRTEPIVIAPVAQPSLVAMDCHAKDFPAKQKNVVHEEIVHSSNQTDKLVPHHQMQANDKIRNVPDATKENFRKRLETQLSGVQTKKAKVDIPAGEGTPQIDKLLVQNSNRPSTENCQPNVCRFSEAMAESYLASFDDEEVEFEYEENVDSEQQKAQTPQLLSQPQKSNRGQLGSQQLKAGDTSVSTETCSIVDIQLPQKRLQISELDSSLLVTEGGRVVVYCDGSSLGNGQQNSRAGYGVFWNYNHRWNTGRSLNNGKASNQRAELRAAIHAIHTALVFNVNNLEIRSDSQYTINSMTKWKHVWKKNGWAVPVYNNKKRVIRTKPLSNYDLLKALDAAEEAYNVTSSKSPIKWAYVPAHTGVPGNEAADKLAKIGASSSADVLGVDLS